MAWRRRRSRVRPPRRYRAVSWLFFVMAAFFMLSVGAVVALRFVDPAVTMVMLLETGPVATIDRRWVDQSDIAVAAARAVIAAEDQRFLEHHGIDLNALSVAWRDYRRGQPLRGASTVTQQVAKNLFLWNGRSYVRKLLEAWFAALIELVWPKQRILEVYLNVAEFGPSVFGIEAAAKVYFGHSAASLTIAEAATLAAVLPSPKRLRADAPSDYVLSRQAQIVAQIRLLEQRGHYLGLGW